MEVTHILDALNEPQRQTVTAPEQNLMVLAGAGSGKTRVLVHRMAWLLQVYGYSTHQILSVTFTNKAAREMRHRIEQLLHINIQSMWVGTFHGLAHRLLRIHWQQAGLNEGFQILDTEDQYRLIRRVHKALELDETRWPPRQSQWYINANKDAGLRPGDVTPSDDTHGDILLRIYQSYEELCERSGLVDFSELLLRSFELLKNNPEILEHYQKRFKSIMVDEFQDTNHLQYQWLRLLSTPENNTMVVGDDDQSIYSWRGAQVGNIQQFQKDYPGTEVIRLEQNYRSTKTILTAANAVISNNRNRMGKQLWTDGAAGEPISIYAAFNELDEARFIVDKIQSLHTAGHSLTEIAILYRSNAQSRVLEEECLRNGIPYRIYGGLRFYDRAEIKDALGYMRLISNRNDDAAFERVVNMPARSIGNTTLNQIREHAKTHQLSLWQASLQIVSQKFLPNRASTAITNFAKLIDSIEQNIKGLPLPDQTNTILNASGLMEYHRQEKTEKGQARLENIEELIQATHSFDPKRFEYEDISGLPAFLAHVALESSEHQADHVSDSVQLMTLHSAKGLEFSNVFISGAEETLFPHRMSMEDSKGLEEERRLCYVGMTRAKEKLTMTYAESRQLHGKSEYHQPSRFLAEIPCELLDEIRMTSRISRPTSLSSKGLSNHHDIPDTGLQIGQRVNHTKFGNGIILNYEGSGDHARIQVNFDNCGSKWLIASFAKLLPA